MSDYAKNGGNHKRHNLLLNRVAIINQLHGCQYVFDAGNPCVVRGYGRSYEVYYGGDLLTTWDIADTATLDAAFRRVDSLADALWLVRRAGFLRMLIS